MGKYKLSLVAIILAIPLLSFSQTKPTSQPSVEAELRKKIEVLQAQIAMLKKASSANYLPADGTTWRMTNGADLQFLSDGVVTCDKWDAGVSCQWKRIDPHTISWIDPDRTEIRATFSSDGKACLFELLSGTKSGMLGYGTLVE